MSKTVAALKKSILRRDKEVPSKTKKRSKIDLKISFGNAAGPVSINHPTLKLALRILSSFTKCIMMTAYNAQEIGIPAPLSHGFRCFVMP